MRAHLVLFLLAFSSAALAQTATPEPVAPAPVAAATAPCAEDDPCAAPAPVPITSARTFFGQLVLTIGLGVWGDVYPVSTVKMAGTSSPQRSLMGGTRFWLGTRLPGWFALRGTFEIGYVTVGPFPGRGIDGIFEGAGLELSLDHFQSLKPFIRFMYDAVVIPISSVGKATPDPTLAPNAFFFHVGVRYSIAELHLAVGRDFSGGVAPGIGFSLSWMH